MPAMLLFLGSVVLLAAGISAQTCPHGFESLGGSCYFFSHGKESWIGAFESCKIFHSMLVEIESPEENAYLVKRSSQLGSRSDWWIGLTDKLVDGEFIWETSLKIIGAGVYSNWASGEPSYDHSENCIRIAHSKSYMWADSQCDDTEHFICEIKNTGVDVVG